uniref:Uncharacterized protein n=1 Tax=Coccidioides posadasii RMSCC 3488 TaxID=454284 RepID=A0A0J6FQC0_COCPO|nr:hypothetical protein CPAG_08882 [Coccidioides posadasii RMSCC 3488]
MMLLRMDAGARRDSTWILEFGMNVVGKVLRIVRTRQAPWRPARWRAGLDLRSLFGSTSYVTTSTRAERVREMLVGSGTGPCMALGWRTESLGPFHTKTTNFRIDSMQN